MITELYVNVIDFGAKGDGVTDDTVAIQKALDNGGDIFFPAGTYVVKNTLKLKQSNTRLFGVKGKTILDWSKASSVFNTIGAELFQVYGTKSSAIKLTTDALKGKGLGNVKNDYPGHLVVKRFDYEIDVASTESINDNNLILITSDFMWIDDAVEHQHGELAVVSNTVDSTKLRLSNQLHEDYLTSKAARYHKITPIENVVIEGLTFRGHDYKDNVRGDYGLIVKYGRNITVRDCNFKSVDQCSVDFISVYNGCIENCDFYHMYTKPKYYIQYASKVSNASMFIKVLNNNYINGRHAVVTGHTVYEDLTKPAELRERCPGIQRHILVEGNTASGYWHAAYSTHNSSEYVTFNNNRALHCDKGFELRCSLVDAVGNQIKHCRVGFNLTVRPEYLQISKNTLVDTDLSIYAKTYTEGFNPKSIMISDNYLLNTTGTGIALNFTDCPGIVKDIVITQNRIVDCVANTYALQVSGKAECVITGNIFRNISNFIISLRGVTNSRASQNIAYDADTKGMFYLVNGTGNTAGGNVIRDNFAYNCYKGLIEMNAWESTTNTISQNYNNGVLVP